MRKSAVSVLLLFICSVAFAQIPGATPFSGDLTITPKDDKAMTGHIYFSGEKLRYDMSMQGHEAVMIQDIPNKVSYMLMPQQMMYMEMHTDKLGPRGGRMPDLKSYDPNNPCAQAENMTCEKAGTETVNGRSAQKWLFKNTKDNTTLTVWIDNKVHFPVRTVGSGVQLDLNNIKEGQPDAAVFTIPPSYRKLNMGGGMPPH